MLENERKLRYNPPIPLYYIAILLISFTFSLTFFQFTNFLNFKENNYQKQVLTNKADDDTETTNYAQKFDKKDTVEKQLTNSDIKKEKKNNNENVKETTNSTQESDEKNTISKISKRVKNENEEVNDKETKEGNNKKENKKTNDSSNDLDSSETIFKNGRTFDHLYTKNLKSPLYSKEFPKLEADTEKMEAVKEAFLHAWSNYDRYCFGHDTLRPMTAKCDDGNLNGGLTIIDSISTIIIMGLEEPYKKVRNFVKNDFAPYGSWSLFEFNIRYLGGLLSAYSLSHDKVFKKAAIGLGDAVNDIMEKTGGFFASSFRLSVEDKDEQKYSAKGSSSIGNILAESGTYQLEFFKLAEITENDKYIDSAISVYKSLWKRNPNHGLITSHIGAGTDSYYEYIIKSYILTGGVINQMLQRHILMMKDIKSSLVFKTINQNLVGLGIKSRSKQPKPDVEHLATFAAGMIAIGSVDDNKDHEEDLKLASELATTYAKTYAHFKSGIMPEHVVYNIDNVEDKEDIEMSVDGYILRPETVESIFYLYRFTGDQKFRDYNWQIFKAINKSCRVKNGFASISKLNNPPDKVSHKDKMESFFLAETLKYLYLTFADSSLISPTEWVFNTEAHPIHIWDNETINKFSYNIEKQLSKALNRKKILEIFNKDKNEDIKDNKVKSKSVNITRESKLFKRIKEKRSKNKSLGQHEAKD